MAVSYQLVRLLFPFNCRSILLYVSRVCSASNVKPTVQVHPCLQSMAHLYQIRHLCDSEAAQTGRYEIVTDDAEANANVLSDEIIDDIVGAVKDVDKIKNARQQDVTKIVQTCLLYYAVSSEEFVKLFTHRPDLVFHPVRQWTDVLKILADYGFSNHQVLNILSSYPTALKLRRPQVVAAVEQLQKYDFHDGDYQRVLSNNPLLFDVSAKDVDLRIAQLMNIFTKTDIVLVTLKMPIILTDEWSSILAKVQYILFAMKITQNAILKSRIFEHSLDHIHQRHEFCLRAGLFKPPDPKRRVPSKNPPLRRMMDTTDSEFLARVCKGVFTVREYRVFCKMLKREEDDEGIMKKVNLEMDQEDLIDQYTAKASYHKRGDKTKHT